MRCEKLSSFIVMDKEDNYELHVFAYTRDIEHMSEGVRRLKKYLEVEK
jgi:hypothetical protein